MRNRILLIDDDHDILQGTALRFRSAGYDVSPASSGKVGVRVASATRPSAIVLDMRMPGMSGMEVLRELKAHEPTRSIPVVALSASLTDEQSALDAGARFFIAKPYNGQELLATVKLVIENEPSQTPVH